MQYTLTGDIVGGGNATIDTTITGLKRKPLPELAIGKLAYTGTAWIFDSTSYLTDNQSITLSGDLTGSGSTSITGTIIGLKNKSLPELSTGNLRYDGSSWVFDSTSYLTSNQSITLSGDLSGSGDTSINSTVSGLKGKALPELSTGSLQYDGNNWVFGLGGSGDILSPLVSNEISITGATTGTIGRMHVCSGSSYTVTLPDATSNQGKLIGFRMSSSLTGLVTLQGASSQLIDGVNTRIMWKGESAILLSDGVGWAKISGTSIPMSVTLRLPTTQTFSANTNTLLNFTDVIISNCPPAFVDAPNKKIIACRLNPIRFDINAGFENTNTSNTFVSIYISKNTGGAFDLYSFETYLANNYAYANTSGVLKPTSVGDYYRPFGLYGSGSFTTAVISRFITANCSFVNAVEIPEW